MDKKKEETILWITFPKGDEHAINEIAKKMLINLEYEHLALMKESNIQVVKESEFYEKILMPMMYEMINSEEFFDFIKKQEEDD